MKRMRVTCLVTVGDDVSVDDLARAFDRAVEDHANDHGGEDDEDGCVLGSAAIEKARTN